MMTQFETGKRQLFSIYYDGNLYLWAELQLYSILSLLFLKNTLFFFTMHHGNFYYDSLCNRTIPFLKTILQEHIFELELGS